MRTSTKQLAAILVVAVFFGSHGSAQTRSGSYSLSYGNQQGGGSLLATGSMSRSSSSRSVSGRVTGNVRILGVQREAGRIEVAGSQSFSSGSGNLLVRAAGFTIWNQPLSLTGSKTIPPTVLTAFSPPPSVWVTVGPVPVRVTGNIGVGVSLNLNWALVVPTGSAGVTGQASAWGHGSASATVGVPGYNAGVQAVLRFANHTLNYNMNATPTSLNGHIAYGLNPIQMTLVALANAWPFQYSKVLASWSRGSYWTPNLLN